MSLYNNILLFFPGWVSQNIINWKGAKKNSVLYRNVFKILWFGKKCLNRSILYMFELIFLNSTNNSGGQYIHVIIKWFPNCLTIRKSQVCVWGGGDVSALVWSLLAGWKNDDQCEADRGLAEKHCFRRASHIKGTDILSPLQRSVCVHAHTRGCHQGQMPV